MASGVSVPEPLPPGGIREKWSGTTDAATGGATDGGRADGRPRLQGVQQLTEAELKAIARTPGNTVVAMVPGGKSAWAHTPTAVKVATFQRLWADFDRLAAEKPTWTDDRVRRHMQDTGLITADELSAVKHNFAFTCERVRAVGQGEHEALRAAHAAEKREYILGCLRNFRLQEEGSLTAEKRRAQNEGLAIRYNIRPAEPGEVAGTNVVDVTNLVKRAGFDPGDLGDMAADTVAARMHAAGMATGSIMSAASRQSDTARALPAATDEQVMAAAEAGHGGGALAATVEDAAAMADIEAAALAPYRAAAAAAAAAATPAGASESKGQESGADAADDAVDLEAGIGALLQELPSSSVWGGGWEWGGEE